MLCVILVLLCGQISHGKYLLCLRGSQGSHWGIGRRGGAVWKTNEEEDRQILQGGSEKMRRSDGEIEKGKRGENAEISSSGFSLKPPVKVNEGCAQSSESDYITAPLINGLSACAPPTPMCALQYLYSCTHTSESHSGAHHQYSIHTAPYTCFHTGAQALLHRATTIQHIVSVGNYERDGQRPDGKQPISKAANDVLRCEKWRMAETLKMERLILCFSKQRSQNVVHLLGEVCSHVHEKVRGLSILTCNNSKWNSSCHSSQTKYDDRREYGKKQQPGSAFLFSCSSGISFLQSFFIFFPYYVLTLKDFKIIFTTVML